MILMDMMITMMIGDDDNNVSSSPKYRTSDIYRCIKHACRILDSYCRSLYVK